MDKHRKGPVWLWILIPVLFFCANLQAAPASFDFSAETAYSNNLSVTPDRMNNPEDGMHSQVAGTLRKTTIISQKLSLHGEVGLGYHQFHIDEPANYWTANAAIAANFRLFSSLDSPYFKLSLAARRKDYSNEFHPDWNLRGKLSVNKQWTSSLKTHAGVALREGYDEWPVVDTANFGYWDTLQKEIFAGMDMRVRDLIVYGELSRMEGDLIWTQSQGQEYLGLLWRDESRVDKLELGINIPLSSLVAIDVLGSFSRTSFYGQTMYDETALSVAYLHRFSF